MPQFPHLQNRDSSYKYHQTIEGKILKLSDFAISILDKGMEERCCLLSLLSQLLIKLQSYFELS